MRTSNDLTKLIGQSGFPLQAGVDQFVTSSINSLGWKVLYREHGWRFDDHQSGFIDLVLEDRYGTSVLVIECKRVLESDWVFLDTSPTKSNSKETRLWATNTANHGQEHCGFFDARSLPESPESMFCVVAGQDAKSRPMLERLAAETIASVEALALEEHPVIAKRQYGLRMYVPVIITTAKLHLSRFNPGNVNMATGEPADVAHEEIKWVRFRKQFSSDVAVAPRNVEWDFSELARAKEKQIFVVNVLAFPEFLSQWKVIDSSLGRLM